MAYQDIGFDEFLNPILPSSQQGSQQLDPLEFDSFTDQISGSKIQGGLLSSADGKVQVDLDKGTFRVINGVQELVQLGILEDGSIGLLIKNNDGKVLMQVSGDKMLLQSPSKEMEINLINAQILLRDETENDIMLIGKQVGGF